jgi:hypothetical protein
MNHSDPDRRTTQANLTKHSYLMMSTIWRVTKAGGR